jgi:hypothetical protein
MTDERDDLFSESPSHEHQTAVREAVAPILTEHRKRARRGFFGWIAAGSVLATAGFAGLVLFRVSNRGVTESVALDEVLFGGDEEPLAITEADLEIDFFEDLEEIETLGEEDFETV